MLKRLILLLKPIITILDYLIPFNDKVILDYSLEAFGRTLDHLYHGITDIAYSYDIGVCCVP
jgi:hypothetical protein